ncbi:uncharacterized protein A1O9_10291 [Exophiala aquamarina CBS 119918]|uniref:Zn(2)-C6 fungal-type domain-containing protein n=1 Tax=Exophiala aquamarina CBS 119918 TaxID=1182545 RepID=A0A072P197_9EURO|nr:uncharacterized protein A1O9_10291 [Exophiala aquamarina CBS 119918]KEF53889.1 hypothetical protein A1O9_10291 [Exophiala aquamarina CBS 119918]
MSLVFDHDPKVPRRRVPDSARRRALISCDRCKTRRIRCARPTEEVPCEACLDSGVPCKSTIPRRRLAYSGPDGTSERYKALEALVQSLFPNEDCNDTQTLFRLAAERNTPIPSHDQAMSLSRLTDAVNSQRSDGQNTTTPVPTSNDPGTAFQTFLGSASTIDSSVTAQTPLSSVNTGVPWPCNVDPAVQGTVTNLAEETCIPAPHGVAHYVGPASSFEFARAVRRLVAVRSETLDDTRTRLGRRSKQRAEFANLKTSIALEPRIQAHPASTVREQSNEPAMDTSPTANEGQEGLRSVSPSRRWLRALVPAREVSDRLVQAFFDRLHPNYILFHRGTFHTRYDSIWQRSPVYRYDREPGWLCSLFMVFVFGAQLLEHDGLEDAAGLQRKFLRHVRERFHHLALTANLPNVQALLLLQLYEHNAGERNTSWILLGQAARMSIALGMHREGTSHNFDAIERNTRRMVWFTLYSFEQYTSLSLGRPSTIKALEVNVQLPDESVLDGSDYPPDYINHASKLMDLTSKVRHFATAASPNCFDDLFLISMVDSLNIISKELKGWYTRLPRHLRPEWCFISPRHLRAVLLLHINYHYIASVLTRPYLLSKVEHDIKHQGMSESSSPPTVRSTVGSLAQECISSSMAIADMLQRLSSESLLEGLGWTDFFYLYHAMLALCLDFLGRPRLSATEEWTVRDRAISANVSFMIEMCQTHQLGPTYQILSQVAIQLAYIVGLGGDDGISRDESEHLQDNPISHDELVAGMGERSTNIPNTEVAATSQHEIFMPYAEPISGITQFNSNGDAFWDFFNVNLVDPMDTSVNPGMQYMANPFQDPFAPSPFYGRYNNWPS